ASLAASVAALPGATAGAKKPLRLRATETASLCGEWLLRPDPEDRGARENWFAADASPGDWVKFQKVQVPHTWQVEPSLAAYRGVAWYKRDFDVAEHWAGCAVRIEFEAVFHTATVWINGELAGEHARKGYTSYTLDITRLVRPGRRNTIAVRVDNSFNEHMLPRGRSSDFPHDGGIYRPVQLLATPEVFVEQVQADAPPDHSSGDAKLDILAQCRNSGTKRWKGHASFQVVDEQSGLEVLSHRDAGSVAIEAGGVQTLSVAATLPKAKLWHFDHPHLYRLELVIADDREAHSFTT